MTHGQIFVALGAALGLALTITPADPTRAPRITETRTAADLLVAHTVHLSVADDLPALEQLESVRFAELVVAPVGQPCR